MSTKISVTPRNKSASKVTVTPKATPVKVHAKVTPTPALKANPVVVQVVEKQVPAQTEESKKQRPRTKTFDELYDTINEDINTAYKHLQSAVRALKSLKRAHDRDVHNTKTRTSTTRTPTIVFDKALVDYFTSRLSPEELKVRRKEGSKEVTVDLSDLSTELRVHRTDVTQLYTKVFRKHNMRNPKDKREILYSQDPELVALLTQGPHAERLASEIQEILNGEYRLTIFNIQRFTNHHLSKVELPPKSKTVSNAETESESTENDTA